MNIVIFKALDKENTLFGLVGQNIRYAGLGIGIACALGFGVGNAVNSLLGFALALLLSAGVYVGMIVLQNKFSNRERAKWLASHKIADFIVAPPRALRCYVYRRCHDEPVQKVFIHLPADNSKDKTKDR